MAVDLIVERHYDEGGVHKIERVTWRHVADPQPMWRWKSRRFRRPRLIQVEGVNPYDAAKGRPLPEWCAPSMMPNRWIWIEASHSAADLAGVAPDDVIARGDGGVDHVHDHGSLWWSLYDIPLRRGVVIVHRGGE